MLKRYVLFQVPGWLGTVLVLSALHVWIDLSPWITLGVVLALLTKDVVLYPVTKHAYDPVTQPAHERMIGKMVVAESGARSGYVRVDGELWNATMADDSGFLAPGTRGRVVALRGLTLLVRLET